ncbi:hypothetical protein PR002_g30914 [Phytophthora rubi]|uniref:Uncharacterized protein n=1 Tax=Phytophthora rubi TaxID=129364 RepID=A0A6A3GHH6_9STRA|nr:hypothetical protein PR002_g30914 [Phytophthora rubi]
MELILSSCHTIRFQLSLLLLAKRRRYAAVVFISWRRPLRQWRSPFRSPRRLAALLAVLCWRFRCSLPCRLQGISPAQWG